MKTVLLAIFNILFFYKEKLINLKISNIIENIGKTSLWIFLIHFPIVGFIFDYFIKFNINFYLNFLIIFTTSTALSYLIAYLCRILYNSIINRLKIKQNSL